MSPTPEEKVKAVLAGVMHPAIARSLVDLGIIKRVEVNEGAVRILMLFPFPNIPIKDMLIQSVQAPLEQEGFTVQVETGTMSPEEVQAFLAMEHEAWRGM